MKRERTIEEAIGAIQNPRLRRYHELEQAFLKGLTDMDRARLPVITQKATELLARWGAYFDLFLGVRPWAFQRVLDDDTAAMTVAAEFPQWVDSTYVPRDAA